MTSIAATTSPPATTTSSASGQTASTTDADARAEAFQYALSAALNAPNVLGGGGGSTADDDDDDGSNLTVKMGA